MLGLTVTQLAPAPVTRLLWSPERRLAPVGRPHHDPLLTMPGKPTDTRTPTPVTDPVAPQQCEDFLCCGSGAFIPSDSSTLEKVCPPMTVTEFGHGYQKKKEGLDVLPRLSALDVTHVHLRNPEASSCNPLRLT